MKSIPSSMALIASCATALSVHEEQNAFNLILIASDSSINGSSLIATNAYEVDSMGLLMPVNEDPDPGTGPAVASVFYTDAATGTLCTNSLLTGIQRFAYTAYSNYTSSLRFDTMENNAGLNVSFPPFTLKNGWLTAPGNLTWAWCPDSDDVGDAWYLPGTVTLGSVFHGCEAIDGLLLAVNQTSS
ncbi:uncharacterized protein TRUGW13939_08870 [Talaromyces rugulosus]|uniref:Uncharacterized protein n=1 Tax=Talaromyces rugulosus TaxID=121627 RepID=A0A7H8R7X0_TALRU|nr:uncharacterized protein TRUGW13939_08870 [Talaromyces rugulosus]QKX61715.1 hypothetical protein TRUGW13939_08870 [Talaromyces rugulosus]